MNILTKTCDDIYSVSLSRMFILYQTERVLVDMKENYNDESKISEASLLYSTHDLWVALFSSFIQIYHNICNCQGPLMVNILQLSKWDAWRITHIIIKTKMCLSQAYES